MTLVTRTITRTPRQATALLETGPADGPLMIFLHGWPGLSIVWRRQMELLAAAGWRCVAPDLRGYGGTSSPKSVTAYGLADVVGDLTALHDDLGGTPAVWVGHDWGAAALWSLAAHHPERCLRIAAMGMPYLPEGYALETLVTLADRDVYPGRPYPAAQWDYWLYQIEEFDKSTLELSSDPRGALNALYQRSGPPAANSISPLAGIRQQGGWFGPTGQAPDLPRDATLLDDEDFETLVAAYERNGFREPNAWYLNGAANIAFAADASNAGRIVVPALFVHAAWDLTCDTWRSPLGGPMASWCDRLTEETIPAGHHLMLEQPMALTKLLLAWAQSD